MSQTSILVIEDNQEVRENLEEILQLSGYTVFGAPDGLAGVRRAIELTPDIILCDVMMPELDGFGVINMLGRNEKTAAIPFVFITARTESEDIRRGMNLGADDYITKPFYKDELLNVVETRLRKAAQRRPAAPEPAGERLSRPDEGYELLQAIFAEHGNELSFERGQLVFRAGEYSRSFYQLAAGHVHLVLTHEYGREFVLTEISTGEFFGLPAVQHGTQFHYSARVASDSATCRVLPRRELLRQMGEHPAVADAIVHLLSTRLIAQGERLVNQAYDSVRRRTAQILCDLHAKYEGREVTLSREEIAQMVGATKESVIRAISEFKKDGYLETNGRSIHVLRAAELRELMV